MSLQTIFNAMIVCRLYDAMVTIHWIKIELKNKIKMKEKIQIKYSPISTTLTLLRIGKDNQKGNISIIIM